MLYHHPIVACDTFGVSHISPVYTYYSTHPIFLGPPKLVTALFGIVEWGLILNLSTSLAFIVH